MSISDWLKRLLGKPVDVPSPSDIIISPELFWTPGAIYDAHILIDSPIHDPDKMAWQARAKREYFNIPFGSDPTLYVYGVPNTRSMDPVIDQFNHVVYVDGSNLVDHATMLNWLANEWLKPLPGEQPHANIIVYSIPGVKGAVHRLTGITQDSLGRLWRFKGDNNFNRDFPAARDQNIMWVCAGLIY